MNNMGMHSMDQKDQHKEESKLDNKIKFLEDTTTGSVQGGEGKKMKD